MLQPDDCPAFDARWPSPCARFASVLNGKGRLQSPSGETRWVTVRSRPATPAQRGHALGRRAAGCQRTQARPGHDARGEGGSRKGQPRQERVPLAHEPRTAHARSTPSSASASSSAWNVFPACSRPASNKSSKGGRHLLDLINEVLDIARIEAGSMEMTLERVNAASALAEAALFTGPLAEQYRVGFVNQVPAGSDLTVTADRGRLLQVLLNLFSNAVKYNREGGEVRFACEMRPDRPFVRFSISDTGPGLSRRRGRAFVRAVPAAQRRPARRARHGDRTDHHEESGRGDGRRGGGRDPARRGMHVLRRSARRLRLDDPLPQRPCPTRGRPNQPTGGRRPRCARFSSSTINPPTTRPLSASSKCVPTGVCLAVPDGRAGLAAARDQRPDVILLDLHLPDLPGRGGHPPSAPRTAHALHPGRGPQRGHHAGTDGPVEPARREGVCHHAVQDPVACSRPSTPCSTPRRRFAAPSP